MTPEEKAKHQRALRLEQQRRYREKNREKMKAYRQRWKKKYPDKRAAERKRWKLKNPEKVREHLLRSNAKRTAKRSAKRRAVSLVGAAQRPRQTRLKDNALWATCSAVLPASLAVDIRDDVIASLVVAFLEGECDMTTLPTFAKREVARHNRLYRDMGAVSLDGFVRGTDNLRLIDTIAADAMHF